ncbi:MAG: hypothetical protein JRJ84_10065 [Deltaproteobacteria bacterium]|nr:hypothetical protein [Deltaproteobacteria bacterium]
MTRRAFLRLLGIALAVTWAATHAFRRVLGRRGPETLVQIGGPEGPVLRVVPLDEEELHEPSRFAG